MDLIMFAIVVSVMVANARKAKEEAWKKEEEKPKPFLLPQKDRPLCFMWGEPKGGK